MQKITPEDMAGSVLPALIEVCEHFQDLLRMVQFFFLYYSFFAYKNQKFKIHLLLLEQT